jgi:putative addiction module component (TIGR02574 family)
MNFASEKIELAQRLLATEDKKIVVAIKKLFNNEENDFHLSSTEKREIDRRLEKIEKGKTNFYSWEEVKNSLGKKWK